MVEFQTADATVLPFPNYGACDQDVLCSDLSPMTAPTTGPPIGTTVGVEQCNDLIESTAQALRRNREPDPDRKSAFGIPNCLLRSHEVARR